MSSNRTITVSYSELSTFRQCPFQHLLVYKERWVKPVLSGALARGTLWHSVLEAHYLVIRSVQQGAWPEITPGSWRGAGLYPGQVDHVLAACQANVDNELDAALDGGVAEEEVEIVRWMYQGHVAKWGIDEQWEILAVEHPIVVPLFDPDTGRKTRFRLKVKLDLVIRDRMTTKTWLVDHKSGAELPKQKDLDFDDQFGEYHAVMKRIGHRVFGSVYSAARTKRNKGDVLPLDDPDRTKAMRTQTLDERFSRVLLARTDTELATIERETLATARAAYSAQNRHERYPNSDTCNWKCGVKEACLVGRKTSEERTRTFLLDTGWTQDPTRH